MKTFFKVLWSLLAVLIVAGAVFCYFRFWFPYAEGTDTGNLNFFSRQGVIFKTYEGKLIQVGTKTGMQSNTFEFSVDNEDVADQLMHNTGHNMELHYVRYFAPLPWRGKSVFVVDSIWSIDDKKEKI